MTVPTLSIEAKIEMFIRLRDTSADFISSSAALHGISGASTSRLYQAMRGSSPAHNRRVRVSCQN